jgi:quercetin dioxygenase-like cupin family protein
MKITRWRADRKPTREEVEKMFRDEGLVEFVIEEGAAGDAVADHRHPFDEVRVMLQGAMRFNVAGNEFILREGDRLELPSNTRHKTVVEASGDAVSICASRV